MANRQTAIEWLIEELEEYFPHEIGGIHLMVMQAKEIEKNQIRASYCKGVNDFYLYEEGEKINWEQYYNETYGK